VSFALPDLRARVPLHDGADHTLGERGGEASHTLTDAEALHGHPLNASSAQGNDPVPANTKVLASPLNATYRPPDNQLGDMASASVTSTGGSQAHENRQPFLALTFCIALQGIFPSQS
jgi:microcystin-dependent protein